MRRWFSVPVLTVYGPAMLLFSLRPAIASANAFSEESALGFIRTAPAFDPGFSGAADNIAHDFGLKEEETIQKSFSLPAEARKSLDIDNVWGSIEVTGGTSNQVQLVVEKTMRAESKDGLERARKEVALDITQQEGVLKLYVNGPFRCRCDGSRGSRDDESYIVKMDFKVQVPRDIDLTVTTVNEGRIRISNVTGNFVVRNVNGDIAMEGIAGSGTAHTVNGPVKISFRQNPRENSGFRTVNGDVELRFEPSLSADFHFKTFNGAVYSDFPVTGLPSREVSEERRGGKHILRADRFTGARVGSGGPEIQVENLNGEIRILENHE